MTGLPEDGEQSRPEPPFRVLVTEELAAKMLDAADLVIERAGGNVPVGFREKRIAAMLVVVADD